MPVPVRRRAVTNSFFEDEDEDGQEDEGREKFPFAPFTIAAMLAI